MSGDSTFSVEVVSFASGAEDQILVLSIAKTFGIPEPDAKGIVRSAPVRVKRGADGATAKALVGQLLALKADVKIINEQSGDEKLYKADAATSIPPPSAAAPVTSIQPEAISRKPTKGPADIPGTMRANAGVSLLQALQSAKDRREGKAPIGDAREKLHSQPPPSGSVPPPAADGGVVIEDCKVCLKKVAAGDICNHCGWSNSQRKRLSPEGKEPDVSSSLNRAIPIAMVGAGLVAGAAAFTLVGEFVGAAVALAIMGLTVVLQGLSTTLRTEKFNVPSASLQKEEKEQIAKTRSKLIMAGVAAVLLGGGVGALHFAGSTAMRLDSLGIAWEANIERGSTPSGRSATISTMHGTHTVAILAATSDGVEYGMMRVTLPYNSRDSFDEALADDILKKCVAAGLGGATVGDLSPVSNEGVQGRSAPLSGTMNDQPAFGSIQVYKHEHEFLLIYVVAPTQEQAEDSTAKSYMSSLKTVTGTTPVAAAEDE